MKSLVSTLATGVIALALLTAGCGGAANTNTAPAGNANAGNRNTAAANTAPPANTAATNTAPGGGAQGGSQASVEIINQTNWDIHHLYVSPVNERNWGPDQLGTNIIARNGGRFRLTNIPCANYDIKVVDNDGDECIIENAEICGGGYEWRITNQELLACEGFGQ